MEHRSPKSCYLRTNRKNFEKQLGNIEQRQARIRRIRTNLNENSKAEETEKTEQLEKTEKTEEALMHEKGPELADVSYHIGKTQNYPIDLGPFSQKANNDPAVKVY